MDQFKEVTVGVDRLYSIPSVNLWHQGTYQCEIYSGQLSIVRLYYYISGNIYYFQGPLEIAIDQWEKNAGSFTAAIRSLDTNLIINSYLAA